RSSMEILTAEVFDGDFDGSGLRSQTLETGLHGSHGRWRCRRQRSSMEILTAVRSSMEILTAAIFDGDVDSSGLRCGAVVVRWVLSICWSSSRREMCLDCSGVGCNFPKL
ncbi:hypothetical protein Dimus_037507, partial [Dionaea muscipula]